jgi:hypothetical protein
MRRVHGSRLDGIWVGSVAAAQLRSVRRWPVSLWAEDRADPQEFEESNVANYSAEDLQRAGFPSWVTIRGGVDGTRPRVGRVWVSSQSVDARTSDTTVTLRARIRDADSGIQRARSHFGDIYSMYTDLRLVSGSRHDGVWAVTVVFDHCDDDLRTRSFRPGVTGWDRAGRWDGRSPDTAAVAVTAGDTTRPTTLPCDSYPPGVTTLCFTEDVTGITTQTAVVHPPDQPASAAVTGSWLCEDRADAATDCEFGRVRTARFTSDTPTSAPLEITLNPPHTLGITDMVGNPVQSYS